MQIFVSVALFNMIRIPLTLLPWAIIDCMKMVVSINRIQAFLNAEELNDECIGNDLRNPKENVIEIKNACLSWNTGKRRESDSEIDKGNKFELLIMNSSK